MFEAALTSLDLPVLIHDDEAVLFANEAACCALKAPDSRSLIGRHVSSLVHEDGIDAGRQRRELVLGQGQTLRDVPVKLVALDGATLYARVIGKRIAWGAGTAILIIATDLGTD
jgi:PAS domain S-box-containing protein